MLNCTFACTIFYFIFCIWIPSFTIDPIFATLVTFWLLLLGSTPIYIFLLGQETQRKITQEGHGHVTQAKANIENQDSQPQGIDRQQQEQKQSTQDAQVTATNQQRRSTGLKKKDPIPVPPKSSFDWDFYSQSYINRINRYCSLYHSILLAYISFPVVFIAIFCLVFGFSSNIFCFRYSSTVPRPWTLILLFNFSQKNYHLSCINLCYFSRLLPVTQNMFISCVIIFFCSICLFHSAVRCIHRGCFYFSWSQKLQT